MSRNPRLRSVFVAPRLSSVVLTLLFLALIVCPHAQSALAPHSTTLRGCLRSTGQRAFILIADDHRGYQLNGDRGVFSRHTDQEVQIAGTASEPTQDDGPLAYWLDQTKRTEAKNKAKQLVSIPGLRTVQVSSLKPLSQQCPATVAVR